MILVLGTFRLPPERMDDARTAMLRMIEASRAEPGCLGYSYAADVAEPGLIRVTECWADRTALDRHFGMPHLQQWRAAWPDLGIGERALFAFESGRGQPL